MKRTLCIIPLLCSVIALSGCIIDTGGTSDTGNTGTTENQQETPTGIYADFYNYPTGKQNASGTLTLKNQVNGKVLVFTDSVEPQNYIGTIPALEEIKVKLASGKFYNIVAVQQSVYEDDPTLATQTSKLAYYSDTQGYTVSVSPENLTGSATWIFNNSTSYWVSVESVTASGETYAVIAPDAKRVQVPVRSNSNFDFRVVYKKELKLNGRTIAVAEKTDMSQNDTATFTDLKQFTTDLKGTSSNDYDDLAPTIKFINNSGKSVRVYNGQVQLSNAGTLSEDEDYVLATGVTAYFTGLTADGNISGLQVRSVAWTDAQTCTQTMTLQKGKVYTVTISPNTDTSSVAAKPIVWAVTESDASTVYN